MNRNRYALVFMEQKLDDTLDQLDRAFAYCNLLMGTEDLLPMVKRVHDEVSLLQCKVTTMRIEAERKEEES